MVPTKRLWWLLALGILVAIAAGSAQNVGIFWGYNLLLLLVSVVTFYMAPSVKDIRLKRKLDPVLSVRVPNKVEVEVLNDGVEPIQGMLREELPPFFQVTKREFPFRLEPGREILLNYQVTPPFRGTDYYRGTFLRVECPLGLVTRDYKLPTEQPLRIYPNVLALREFDLLKQKGKLREMGVRISRMRGLGTEFESLRDYAEGDDFRKIDWKASARRNKLIVKQFEQERNQPVIVAIDIGRRMLSEVGGVAKLDLALDSLLMLLHAASVAHDLVGLLVYSDHVVRYIPPRKGRSQMGIVIDAIHDLAAEPIESDPMAAFSYLSSKWKRRALIVAFTDLETDEEARRLSSACSSLVNRHILVIARVADPRLKELTSVPVNDEKSMYSKSAALQFVDERARAGTVLETFGIANLEAEPQDLAAALVSFYFTVKEKSLL